jgi:hypothetical protein
MTNANLHLSLDKITLHWGATQPFRACLSHHARDCKWICGKISSKPCSCSWPVVQLTYLVPGYLWLIQGDTDSSVEVSGGSPRELKSWLLVGPKSMYNKILWGLQHLFIESVSDLISPLKSSHFQNSSILFIRFLVCSTSDQMTVDAFGNHLG